DTTRQVGGALGIAIIGSVLSSIYASKMGDFLAGTPVTGHAADTVKQSLGAALGVAHGLAKTAPQLASSLANTANNAFVDGMHVGVLVAAGATLLGAVIAFIWLPARARLEDLEAQRAAQMERDRAPARPPAPEPSREDVRR